MGSGARLVEGKRGGWVAVRVDGKQRRANFMMTHVANDPKEPEQHQDQAQKCRATCGAGSIVRTVCPAVVSRVFRTCPSTQALVLVCCQIHDFILNSRAATGLLLGLLLLRGRLVALAFGAASSCSLLQLEEIGDQLRWDWNAPELQGLKSLSMNNHRLK